MCWCLDADADADADADMYAIYKMTSGSIWLHSFYCSARASSVVYVLVLCIYLGFI